MEEPSNFKQKFPIAAERSFCEVAMQTTADTEIRGKAMEAV